MQSLAKIYPEGVFVVTDTFVTEPPYLGLAILGSLAILTISISTFWGGKTFFSDFKLLGSKLTVLHGALMLGMMCAMLVLLASFPAVMGYVVKTIFFFTAFMALQTGLDPLVDWSYARFPNPQVALPAEIKTSLFTVKELRQALLAVLSLALPSLWLFLASVPLPPWDWLLLDFLAVFNTIFTHRFLQVRTLKHLTVVLAVVFVYDIFFVFVTPLITGGTSIMEQAALGLGAVSGQEFTQDTTEPLPRADDVGPASTVMTMETYKPKLPMMFIVYGPFGADPKYCRESRVILGFGDLFLPGLLGAFCHAWDIYRGLKFKPYWATFICGYVVSIPVTFAVMLLSGLGQPALLYIVPLTLIPVVLVALVRGELKLIWQGIGDLTADPATGDGTAGAVGEATPMQPVKKAGDSQGKKGESSGKVDEV